MNSFTRFLLSAFAGFACIAPLQAAPKPNVLLICIDDLKPNLGCYGSVAKTPNVDKLASRGMLFERAYCNQAVCAPSRNALMTGLRSTTLGIYDLATFFRTAAPDALTVAQTFKNAGYRTEGLGKILHVGHGNHEDPVSWTVPHWRPQAPMYVIKSNLPAGEKEQMADASKKKKKGKAAARSNAPRGATVECADVSDSTYADGLIAEEAVRRLEAAREKEEPFFIAVGFLKPHLPFVAPKRYWDLYKREQFKPHANQQAPEGAPSFAPTTWGELRNYSDVPDTGPLTAAQQVELIHGYHAAVSYTDAQIGRVLDELAKLGLDKSTIVVLWGDHGWHLGDHGMWCKHTNYEEAARIPLIVSQPGVVAAGAKVRALVETVDLYPTLCELAGVNAPQRLDGKSFVETLKNPSKDTKSAIFHVFPRSPAGQGELIGRAVRTARYRLVEWKPAGGKAESAVIELYDYLEDAGETKNLAASKPEIVKDLRAILARQPEAKPQVRAGG
jgi:iduronate 2-sulfatase